MARVLLSKKKKRICILETVRSLLNVITQLQVLLYLLVDRHYRKFMLKSESYFTASSRKGKLDSILSHNDRTCINQLRMNRPAFNKLCHMLRMHGKLTDNKHIDVEEMVAMFLHIIAHHVKNRVMINRFERSGETISRHFNEVLNRVIRLQSRLLKAPEAIAENSTDRRWKWFKNCLGALDGTYIRLNVHEVDRARYRTRKSDIATNVLGVCSHDMQFTFVLPGWEGSAADSRVLRDAISRRHGLKVPRGFYYLVDAGYPNSEGFLAPYRGQRYHLNDWRTGHQPTTPHEFFNMKHSSARNVIERTFGLLKRRWGILRSPSFYPVKTQIRIITACVLLHNFIRQEMPTDPMEHRIAENYTEPHGDPIEYVDASDTWGDLRDNMATEMFNEWRASRNS